MTRTVDYENFWGDDGDVLVVFGHVDTAELRAAALDWMRREYGDPDAHEWLDKAEHVYAVVAPWVDDYEPWLYYQHEPTHPDGLPVVPITLAEAGGWTLIPAVATIADRDPRLPLAVAP